MYLPVRLVERTKVGEGTTGVYSDSESHDLPVIDFAFARKGLVGNASQDPLVGTGAVSRFWGTFPNVLHKSLGM